jgi:hypothetical protein
MWDNQNAQYARKAFNVLQYLYLQQYVREVNSALLVQILVWFATLDTFVLLNLEFKHLVQLGLTVIQAQASA